MTYWNINKKSNKVQACRTFLGYGGLLGKIQMLKLNFETFELLIQTVEDCVIFDLFEEKNCGIFRFQG